MTYPIFNEATWIERLAAALEQVAVGARPSYSPLPPAIPGLRPIGERWEVLHSGYRALAARAKHDPTAAVQFRESRLSVTAEPVEAMAILREHPLVKSGLKGSGTNEGFGFWFLNRPVGLHSKPLVLSLAKLSVKEGGQEAARRLHRFVTALANRAVPAHEITVVHGLVVQTRFDLAPGAYLAPYREARAEFDLPDQPEPFPDTILPDAAVLVRGIELGPVLAPFDYDAGLPDMRIAYCFPGEYQVDFERWFDDSKLLVDLLSIVKQVPLLSHTQYVRLAGWVEEIEPNLAFGTQSSRSFVSDMWPRGQHLSQGDVDAFLELARGWHRYPDKPNAISLAIHRLAGSLSRPGGRFGQEDCILDIAIALEVFYGGKTGHNLAQRAAALLGGTAAEQKRTYDLSKGFYDVRSGIVHSKDPPSLDLPDKTLEALEAGRNLACRTLAILFNLDAPLQWADVMKSLLPETQAYIKKAKGQPDK